ncbi:MAG: hypothetical protein IKA06_00970 [Clostridia bacterium]|nr:hypothetical protein [Clostridia bacterium]
MGKGNRTKKQQAANVLSGTGKKKNAGKKREMPTWVGTLIVALVLVAVILFSTFCILNSRGVFLRNKIIVKSEHFEVSVPMMSYMVYTEYQDWVNNYQNTGYMQYIKGEGGDGLSTSIPLREQNYSVTTDKTTGVTTTVTWFDYFAERAASSVEQVVVLCEQAHSLGITLTDEELAEIDSAIEMVEWYAAYSGYTTSGYLSAMYGKGVGERDVREMMELIELATKMTNLKTEEFKNGATDVRVDNYYQENKDDLDIYVDFISYTFEATFTPVADSEEDAATKNEEAYEEYEEKKSTYEERVEALESCTTAKEFCDLLIEYLKEDGATEVEAVQKQSDAHHINYKRDEQDIDLEDWLFDTKAPVQAGDTHAIKDKGDEARESDDNGGYTYNKTSASYTACFVLKPVHRDDAYLQNVGHILFKTDTFKDIKDASGLSKLSGKTKELAQSLLDKGQTVSAENMAKALVDLMIAEGKLVTKTTEDGETYYYMDKDAFEAYAEVYTEDSGVFYENVKRGDMVSEFDAWIYDDARIQNEVSPSAIKTTYGYHIMFYNGHAEEINWRASAREAITSADYEAWYKTVSAACTIDVTADYWGKIN